MKAADIMTSEVITISSAAPVAVAIAQMRKHQVRSLIVERHHEEDAYGIVTETDIVSKVVAYGQDPQQMRVYEIMTKPCIVVNPDLQVEYVARLLTQANIHIAPVIEKKLLGVISISDILTKADFAERPQATVWEQRIQTAIAQARSTCHSYGVTTQKCRQAWETVEKLQAEAAHQRSQRLEQTALEAYSEEYPEVKEAWLYDVWCSG
ncbi:CBS domain-containing protein [Almyronema epifaneia]|uniref:CBS domain-containing protein n=1 Tax=Almyronema epifaneia S1 TaxID=2991925 RepID=A0ABW6ICD9_9CYAN